MAARLPSYNIYSNNHMPHQGKQSFASQGRLTDLTAAADADDGTVGDEPEGGSPGGAQGGGEGEGEWRAYSASSDTNAKTTG